MFVHACMLEHMYKHHVHMGATGGQKRVLDPLAQESENICGYQELTWVLSESSKYL